MNRLRTAKGFTLSELLITIAIIGILSSVVVSAVTTAKNNSYDAARITNLTLVQVALEQYYADHDQYPPSKPGVTGVWADGGWRGQCSYAGSLSTDQIIPGLIPNYLPSMPIDPQMNATTNKCCYLYNSDGVNYKFLSHDCPTSNYNARPSFIDPGRDGGSNSSIVDGSSPWAWSVYTPGAVSW